MADSNEASGLQAPIHDSALPAPTVKQLAVNVNHSRLTAECCRSVGAGGAAIIGKGACNPEDLFWSDMLVLEAKIYVSGC